MAFVPKNRAEVEPWLSRFYDVSDKLDATRISTVYTEDAKVQFSNMPLMEGLDALRSFFVSTWDKLEMMHHGIGDFDLVGDKIYHPCNITWKVKGDPEKETIVVPAFAVFHLVTEGENKGLVSSAEFYMDCSPLMAAIQRSSV
ncbi:hypothetical protein F4809DRAFT_279420 [Biscogniauxia mediterranea]|nr:hypothetical protein F4809DRAFT_279420 [Biscogniauxia mediterranea]